MKAFIKTSENLFGGPGIQLKQRVHTELDYYNDIENSVDVKGGFYEKKNGFFSGIDKFPKNFLSMCLAKYGNHRNSIMFCHLKRYVSKENKNKNPEYGTKVYNLFLSLSTSDNRAFGFVSYKSS